MLPPPTPTTNMRFPPYMNSTAMMGGGGGGGSSGDSGGGNVNNIPSNMSGAPYNSGMSGSPRTGSPLSGMSGISSPSTYMGGGPLAAGRSANGDSKPPLNHSTPMRSDERLMQMYHPPRVPRQTGQQPPPLMNTGCESPHPPSRISGEQLRMALSSRVGYPGRNNNVSRF